MTDAATPEPTGTGYPVPGQVPLATSTDTSMWLDEVVVYPGGIVFRLCATGEAIADDSWHGSGDVVEVVVTLPSGIDVVTTVDPVIAGPHRGVEGRTATRRGAVAAALLNPMRYISEGDGWSQTLWLSPVPVTGTVLVTVTWASHGVRDAVGHLEVDELRRYLR